MSGNKKKKFRFDISAWVVVSAVAVLAVMLGMMIFMQFQLRKDQAVTLFVEKGSTLISSFEAGLRGRLESGDDAFYLQKLLMETAQQPDIDYLVVTDGRGQILADSDPSMLGRPYGLDLKLQDIVRSREIRWRQTSNQESAGTFEVYRGLSFGSNYAGREHLIVFVGFNMDKIEKASREDTFGTVAAALILVLIGSLAIVSLFLVQAYRLARKSLSRITIFSQALVKNMPIGLLAVDKHGLIVACNEQAQGFLAGGCSDAVGREAGQLLPAAFFQMLGKIDEKTGLVEEDIAIASKKEGVQLWETVAAAFANEDVPEGKILLARNVTMLRQMEQDVARSRHLNAIASLAAGVAHEIRNPLSSIKGFAVYLKQRLAGNPEDEQTADIMIAETERVNRVISQLIEFARPLTMKIEPADMEALARHTIGLIAVEALNQSVEIDVQTEPGLPKVFVDPDRIKQVLLNIFLNALSAMPGGGRLSVEITRKNEGLAMEISDTGSGIREEDLPRIYDPYFTSKPAGTGLGLAVVQKIMAAHGGMVQIESKTGAGTKVALKFPVSAHERVKNE